MKKIPITSLREVEEIINSVEVCTLAMVDGDMPYAIPMNFAYSDGYLYFHGAPFGRRIEILKNNSNVCAVFYNGADMYIQNEKVACSYSMKFRSVLVNGKLENIIDDSEKRNILNKVMKHYVGKDDFKYSDPAIKNVHVVRLKLDNYTAYKRGY
ncbi:MAG: pyridoxamine 5'-phosphate oxidase family protein [Bacteroidales bacterium]|nr:pyridoxamine 5'-phosphate oxidase family protein [Bacteroidales bacterium]